MSKLKLFKKDLNEALAQFGRDAKPLSIQESKAIVELKQQIQEAESAMLLRQKIERALPQLPGRSWGFVPFVLNLRKALQKVLDKPDYHPNYLLADECQELRNVNKQLQQDNSKWQKKADAFMQSGMEEMQKKASELQETIRLLREELAQERANFAAAQQLHELEKQQLGQEINLLKEQNQGLKDQQTTLQNDKEELYKKYLQQLAEKEQLEKALEAERAKHQSSSRPAASTPFSKLGDYRKFFNINNNL